MTQPSKVRLSARIKVLDMKSGQVLGTQVFEAVEPAPSEDAYGAVRATNAAVGKVLGEMVPFALAIPGITGGSAASAWLLRRCSRGLSRPNPLPPLAGAGFVQFSQSINVHRRHA